MPFKEFTGDARKVRPNAKNNLLNWLGVVPFFVFALAFLILPTISIFVSTFQDAAGHFTLQNIKDLFSPYIINAYRLSIKVSLFTAVSGSIFGFLLAYAATLGGLPKGVQSFLNTFSGVASNFAGVPLSFAFISTLGRVGLVTVLLQQFLHISLYDIGFNLYSFWGLCLVYLYFQFPLMVLLITPSLEGLRKEWREASENLGATNWQYWRYVAFPILLPSLLASTVLLFGNAFGAYATAYALTGGSLNLVPIMIGAEIRGDILHNVGLGYALAFGMVVIMGITIFAYNLLQRKSARWLQ
jgi:putative spermidine/putrescine transport system permease protein